jgi:hypothetical protein
MIARARSMLMWVSISVTGATPMARMICSTGFSATTLSVMSQVTEDTN